MKRRTFLNLTAAVPAATPAETQKTITTPLPFEKLRTQYRHDLFDDFLPFMDRHVIDHDYGGFMCNTDRDGTNLSQGKTAWYEGRGIWVYSFLYNHFAKEKTVSGCRAKVGRSHPENQAARQRALAPHPDARRCAILFA